ncbi:MAG: SAM-dependent chlorinase/fluorinase [Bacteroidota bacterium]
MTVTLTTDFGTQDGYVAAMKGTMLGIAPEIRFVDISHQVSPQDVMEAAWVLRQSAWTFPEGTIHLGIVDPGVGTSRRPLAARFHPAGSDREHLFVGPDNGLLSLLTDGVPPRAVVLDRPEFWRSGRTSRTFHGRDVFAPVAAHLASGVPLRDVGSVTEELAVLRWPLPRADEQGVEGSILHVDRFGNCVTNIPRETVEAHRADRLVSVYAGSTIIRGISETYAHGAAAEPIALFGSSGALEVSVNRGDAAELLSLRRGGGVRLIFESPEARSRRLGRAA